LGDLRARQCGRYRAGSLNVSDDELAKRRAEWQPPAPKYGRGYGALYLQHITQANEGCDFDFLEAGAPIPEPEIH
jgi:dihydroxy-acid dehydratase